MVMTAGSSLLAPGSLAPSSSAAVRGMVQSSTRELAREVSTGGQPALDGG